jgi:hypothetical protein
VRDPSGTEPPASRPILQPKYIKVENRKFIMENEAEDILCIKKCCQPVKIGTTTPDLPMPIHNILPA